MICTLLTSVRSYNISLNSDNYYKEIQNHSKDIVFLKIWDTWCPHCQAFQPAWEQLLNNSDFKERVLFADINCAENQKICDSLPGNGTPRLFIFEADEIKPKEYLGPHSYESINRYLKGILSPALQKITKYEINDIFNESSEPIFIYQFGNKMLHKKKIAEIAISSIPYRPFRSYYIETEKDKCSLFVHNKNRKDIYFSGKFEVDEIMRFLFDRYIVPDSFFGTVTEAKIKSSNTTVAVLTFNMSDKSVFPLINEVSPIIESCIPITTCYCRVYKPFCDHIGITDRTPSLTIVNNVIESFWKYNGNLSDFNSVKNWINGVLSGEIKSDENKIMKLIMHFINFIEIYTIRYPFVIIFVFCLVFVLWFKILINKKLKSE